jgi:hypothetical protein
MRNFFRSLKDFGEILSSSDKRTVFFQRMSKDILGKK